MPLIHAPDDLLELLAEQLAPTSADQALADQAQALRRAHAEAEFKAIELDFSDLDDHANTTHLEKGLGKGNADQESAFTVIKEKLDEAGSALVDALGDRLETTAKLARKWGMVAQWPGSDWWDLLTTAHARQHWSDPSPGHYTAYWRTVITYLDLAELEPHGRPLGAKRGGDWTRVWAVLTDRQSPVAAQPADARTLGWLNGWVALAESAEVTTGKVSSPLALAKHEFDDRPTPVKIKHALETARLAGLTHAPGTTLKTWAQAQPPRPLSPAEYPWALMLQRLAKATPRERPALAEGLQAQVSGFAQADPATWIAWVAQPATPAVPPRNSSYEALDTRLRNWVSTTGLTPTLHTFEQLLGEADVTEWSPHSLRAWAREQQLAQTQAGSVSRPRFRS